MCVPTVMKIYSYKHYQNIHLQITSKVYVANKLEVPIYILRNLNLMPIWANQIYNFDRNTRETLINSRSSWALVLTYEGSRDYSFSSG